MHGVSIQTFLADLVSAGIKQQMIGADQLKIMGSVYNSTGSLLLFPLFLCRQQNRGRQLEIEIVDVHNIRLELFEQLIQFLFRFPGIDDL